MSFSWKELLEGTMKRVGWLIVDCGDGRVEYANDAQREYANLLQYFSSDSGGYQRLRDNSGFGGAGMAGKYAEISGPLFIMEIPAGWVIRLILFFQSKVTRLKNRLEEREWGTGLMVLIFLIWM